MNCQRDISNKRMILFLYFLLVANCSYLPQTRPTVRQLVLRGGFRTIANFDMFSCFSKRNNTNNTKGKIENNSALVENIQTC